MNSSPRTREPMLPRKQSQQWHQTCTGSSSRRGMKRNRTSRDSPGIHTDESKFSGSRANLHDEYGWEPWRGMAQTYAWVLEQEVTEMARKNEEILRWVRGQQQGRDELRRKTSATSSRPPKSKHHIDALDFGDDSYDIFEEIWRATSEWQRAAERVMQEELRRLQRIKQETERYRRAFEKRVAAEKELDRRRAEAEVKMKTCRDEANRRAWRTYETRWAAITSAASTERITFKTTPWPMFSAPQKVDDITPARIAVFVLSSAHSESQSRRDKIRAALRRWHPDRFGRLLGRVDPGDRKEVEKGVGIVVRCLNNLLERES